MKYILPLLLIICGLSMLVYPRRAFSFLFSYSRTSLWQKWEPDIVGVIFVIIIGIFLVASGLSLLLQFN